MSHVWGVGHLLILQPMSAGNPGAGFEGKHDMRGPAEASHLFRGSIGLAKQLAHNLKVTGSNPVPATKFFCNYKDLNVERFAYV